ncbi:MAG: hypothetical protein KatS3mg131_2849 [Candidatus Tectimicrobiota bacterium]|nr:MAG: hypothetical protein KatS3mg131_2849 [Candidatus Tectomicrobia bacterium]
MRDAECVAFLRWALPQLHLHWPGFRRVRRQVCKRLARRLRALGLGEVAQYRQYLLAQPQEWAVLDRLCHISISRFYRDAEVFAALASPLAALACQAQQQGERTLWCWSAGCASGEEAYSLVLLWAFVLQGRFPALRLRVVATDADVALLRRARRACYPASSVRGLPPAWQAQAFAPCRGGFCLRPAYRDPVLLCAQDLRCDAPQRRFWLILCRNVAFTYFVPALQREVLRRLVTHLFAGGLLLIGAREALPVACPELAAVEGVPGLFRRR